MYSTFRLRHFTRLLAFLTLGTAVFATQQTASPPASATASASASVTITGCLVRDAARGNAVAKVLEYKLTKIQAGVASGPTGPSNSNAPGTVTSGPVAAPAARSSQTGEDGVRTLNDVEEYRLAPAAGVNLAMHVNHQVRVVGTMSPEPSGPGSGFGRDRGEQANAIRNAIAPTIGVSAVTMVSATCPG